MTASPAELVQVRYRKLKNINFTVSRICAEQTHVHSSMEIGVILEGQLQVTGNSGAYAAGPGGLLVFNAYDIHSIVPQGQATVLFVQLAPSFGKAYFARMVGVEFSTADSLPDADRTQICNNLLAAAEVYFSEPEAFGLECASLVAKSVTLMLRTIPYKLNTDAEYMAKKKRIGRKQRIASFLEQHYRDKLTLTQLAQSEGITTAYMSRIFGELFHDSFQEYLSRLRLQRAMPMLGKPSVFLVDICMECGFSDTRYLNAICKKEYGCTAIQLRQKMQDPLWKDPHAQQQPEEEPLTDQQSLELLQAYNNRQQ